jgi:hypothetical protein
VLGIFCSIPFAVSIGMGRSRKKKAGGNPAPRKKRGGDEITPELAPPGGPYDID